MSQGSPEDPFKRNRLTVVEAGMMADDELADIAMEACSKLVRENRDYKSQPGMLAEAIDDATGVGFEMGAFIALSPAVERM